MDTKLKFRAVESVPSFWEPDTFYAILTDPQNLYVDCYITSKSGIPKQVGNEDFILSVINNNIPGGSFTIENIFNENSPNALSNSTITQEINNIYDTINQSQSFINENLVPLTLGGYEAGEPATPQDGLNIQESFDKLLFPTILPTINQPSFNLNLSGNNLRKIGVTTTFDIIFNFNRGSILGGYVSGVWDENEEQGKTAGAATSYTIDGQAGLSSNILNVTKTVQQGLNSFSGTVFYAEGGQPVDSNGDNVGTPLSAGNQTETVNFEGVYPLFATVSNITTLTELSLYSMLNANNIEIELIGETGGNKQKFEIPDVWLANRGTPKIEYFNTFTNQYENTDKIEDFDTSPETQTIEGDTGNYTRFTHNKSDRSNIKIRLIF